MITYNFIKYLALSIKYNRILKKVYKDENILEGLSQMLGAQLKQDWVGRIYTVINPYITDGEYDPNKQIFELGNDDPSLMVVEKFIMERLAIANNFIKANNLFDLLTYKIEKIDDYHNYLFMMYPIPYVDLFKWSKWFALLLGVIAIIAVIILIIL